jgi:phenylalanine-4-hydroxylase
MPLTGWSLHVVPSISPQNIFFDFLSKKKFTATCWLRTMEQLDYIEEPDMFHDVFAHVPLLSNKAYCNFFKGISDIAIENRDNPKAIELLGRIYWFTIEFGALRENGSVKAYGTGLLSSAGELEEMGDAELRPLDLTQISDQAYDPTHFQPILFCANSFKDLYRTLRDFLVGW